MKYVLLILGLLFGFYGFIGSLSSRPAEGAPFLISGTVLVASCFIILAIEKQKQP